MVRVLLYYGIPLALMIYAVADCAADSDVDRFSVPKVLWILLIILVPVFGPLAWLAAAKLARPRPRPAQGIRPAWRERPVAPDDNPQFLRRLAEEQFRRERERRRRERGENGDSGPSASSH
ncbi:MAG: PLD nuclease N-terminal domain-containing protein [Bifidobacteriaceae bacterium]|jgi:hypothetical protein|nr:PLD nuclease N-terminal domain-containing protein [Bifidobacteriaceae bacterium]